MRFINPDKISLRVPSSYDGEGNLMVSLSDVQKAIAQAPSEDVVEVRHEHWEIIKYYFGNPDIRCSGCHYQKKAEKDWGEIFLPHFCEKCGAKMDAKRKDQSDG